MCYPVELLVRATKIWPSRGRGCFNEARSNEPVHFRLDAAPVFKSHRSVAEAIRQSNPGSPDQDRIALRALFEGTERIVLVGVEFFYSKLIS